MAQCDTSSLMADAACFSCLPSGQMEAIKLSLLCRIAQSLDANMTCDPATLIEEARCFTCLPAGMLQIVQTQLLCNIAGATASGLAPSDQVSCGNGEPVAAPTATCALYVDLLTTALYYWDGAAWQLKV